MLRLALLGFVTTTLAQIAPQGCALVPVDQTPPQQTERGTIETDASGPETASAGETVTLSAIAVSDIDGGAVTYSWLQSAGPGVAIRNAASPTAEFDAPSLPEDKTLAFMVTTANERGDVGRANVQVAVPADPDYTADGDGDGETTTTGPIARAGVDRDVDAGSTALLDASSSRGNNLTYLWEQTSGRRVQLENADTVRARFTAPSFQATGTNQLEFELTVRDDRGRTDSDRVEFTVRESADDADPRPRVRIETTMGNIVIELDRENAPTTVANFLAYVDDDFYDGLLFHRVIEEFVIQGGGFEPGLVRREPTRDPIENESDNGLSNVRGTIAMARTSDPDSANSQFYINLVDNTDLDGGPNDATGYTVFGEVVEGLDVVDAIGAVNTESRNGFQDVPVQDVVIDRIVRVASADASSDSTGEGNERTP